MLAQNNRLRRASDIGRVFRRGNSGSAEQLHLKAFSSGQGSSRLAVVVGKKVSKKAVVRNRIRRRVKGMMEPLLSSLSPTRDIVVYIRNDVSSNESDNLRAQLAKCLERAGVIDAVAAKRFSAQKDKS